MLYSNSDTILFEDVKSSLLSKEKLDHDIHTDSATSLVVRGRPTEKMGHGGSRKNRSKSRNPPAGKTCKFCGKLGHIVVNCWKLKNKKEKEEKENQSKKPATANCVVESESEGDVLVVTMSLATTSGKGVDDDWVLDSGCTYHMCKFTGISTVQIKTHDGVVRTSSKVRHIADMTRNLISLGTLEANGCRYSAQNGVLKVTKGPWR